MSPPMRGEASFLRYYRVSAPSWNAAADAETDMGTGTPVRDLDEVRMLALSTRLRDLSAVFWIPRLRAGLTPCWSLDRMVRMGWAGIHAQANGTV